MSLDDFLDNSDDPVRRSKGGRMTKTTTKTKKPTMPQLNVRVPLPLLCRLAERADREHRTVGAMARLILSEALDRLDKEEVKCDGKDRL